MDIKPIAIALLTCDENLKNKFNRSVDATAIKREIRSESAIPPKIKMLFATGLAVVAKTVMQIIARTSRDIKPNTHVFLDIMGKNMEHLSER
ncbi:hypothetical protein PQ465_11545 [Sphingobacterium oryzagri]|uniref:Uncharacterized protein n=1 Tax=Sphingobacterium oryzagri TaxID=3025669 RepID=A0ABY7WF89_9SPHI|nr:hypothetical protein [Sphingobacterium sp. KACC 22765]WDF66940.1 hypothetical protein PQ465_11545 [Sphingobacterium sp. KACC 22765]